MSFEDNFKEAIKRFLEREGKKVSEVLAFEEDHQSGTCGCRYCAYDEWYVDITFKNDYGLTECFSYEGHFADLIRELTLD